MCTYNREINKNAQLATSPMHIPAGKQSKFNCKRMRFMKIQFTMSSVQAHMQTMSRSVRQKFCPMCCRLSFWYASMASQRGLKELVSH